MSASGLKVVEGPYRTPLSDIPGILRRLADLIEHDGGAKACIVLIDWCSDDVGDYACDLRSIGAEADPLRTIGLLRVASADLERQVNEGRIARQPGV